MTADTNQTATGNGNKIAFSTHHHHHRCCLNANVQWPIHTPSTVSSTPITADIQPHSPALDMHSTSHHKHGQQTSRFPPTIPPLSATPIATKLTTHKPAHPNGTIHMTNKMVPNPLMPTHLKEASAILSPLHTLAITDYSYDPLIMLQIMQAKFEDKIQAAK